jgi:hypothetical protein
MTKKLQSRTMAGLGVAAGAGAALLISLGNAPLAGAQPDDALTDLFNDNIAANHDVFAAADSAVHDDYLAALPNVSDAAALAGLNEIVGQLNDQLANADAADAAGLQAVLGADFFG